MTVVETSMTPSGTRSPLTEAEPATDSVFASPGSFRSAEFTASST